jgi:hypothetical protein
MSNKLKEVTENYYYELKEYVEALELKRTTTKNNTFKDKEALASLSEDEILEAAFNVFSDQSLHQMDILTMEMSFKISYENTISNDFEIKFDEEVKGTYNSIKNKQTKPFYLLDKEKQFKALDENKVNNYKKNFMDSVKQTNSLDFLTEQLELELNRKK